MDFLKMSIVELMAYYINIKKEDFESYVFDEQPNDVSISE